MNDDLLSIIDGGEASKVEFKSSLQRDTKTQTKNEELIYEVIKTICAFLNTD
jgi:predicted HTH transcriptional regulator